MNRFPVMIYNIYYVYIINLVYEITNTLFVTGDFILRYP